MRKIPFYLKYARSFFLRNKPVLCHFFVTERCNLKCHYCSVYKNPTSESNYDTTKKIIDRIAKLGVANLSITGGEPLMREDIYRIIDYASAKIPYVRITSNGTLPVQFYERLLTSPINGISISVDSMSSDDPRCEKAIPKALDAIDHLFKNRKQVRIGISTSLHNGNVDKVSQLVEFCGKRWPGLQLFIQPIVVGKGNVRAEGKRVDPSVLFELSGASNVANTAFFNRICGEYFTDPDFTFKCLAGRLFFGVRPDGAFWACHDVPTGINILDDDFFDKLGELDFDEIAEPRKCGSCIYSCYINLQKGFESLSPTLLFTHIKEFVNSFT